MDNVYSGEFRPAGEMKAHNRVMEKNYKDFFAPRLSRNLNLALQPVLLRNGHPAPSNHRGSPRPAPYILRRKQPVPGSFDTPGWQWPGSGLFAPEMTREALLHEWR